MKETCLILVVLVGVAATISIVDDNEWETFKTTYNKQYSAEEDVKRRKIFSANKILVEEHNQKYEEGKVTYEMGINGFADMLVEETGYLKGYNKDYSSSKASYVFDAKKDTPYPATVDWRVKGYVTPVKLQEGCGCSWAFSATGSLEGQNAIKNRYLASLSEQNLVDCVGPNGCSGGKMTDAFDYVRDNHGIDNEYDYIYLAKEGTCKFDPRKIAGYCSGYVNITSGSEEDLLAAVATIGPISVAIDTNHIGFLLYRSGVYYNPGCSSDDLDHAALVVGYGTYYGDEYWEVKNSWGPFWGYRGYIRMAKNKGNNCGIATAASYPLVY